MTHPTSGVTVASQSRARRLRNSATKRRLFDAASDAQKASASNQVARLEELLDGIQQVMWLLQTMVASTYMSGMWPHFAGDWTVQEVGEVVAQREWQHIRSSTKTPFNPESEKHDQRHIDASENVLAEPAGAVPGTVEQHIEKTTARDVRSCSDIDGLSGDGTDSQTSDDEPEKEVDNVFDKKACTSSADSDEEISDDAYKVVWLPLPQWRLVTGFEQLDSDSINKYYMGDQAGWKDSDKRLWYKIAPDNLKDWASDPIAAFLAEQAQRKRDMRITLEVAERLQAAAQDDPGNKSKQAAASKAKQRCHEAREAFKSLMQ